MNTCDSELINKLLIIYRDLGEKKLMKKIVKNINTNKKLHLIYFKKKFISICTLPSLGLILVSKQGFISFCYSFFSFLNSKDIFLNASHKNVFLIAKFVIYHEVGHILDEDIQDNKIEYDKLVNTLLNNLIKYDIDINIDNLHKKNLPYDVENCALMLKKNLINREVKAWQIASNLIDFEDKNEKLIFDNIKEYALATYNFGNIKNIIQENNIDKSVKYKKAI